MSCSNIPSQHFKINVGVKLYLSTSFVVVVVYDYERKAVICTHSSKPVDYSPLSSVTRLFLDGPALNNCLHLDFFFSCLVIYYL